MFHSQNMKLSFLGDVVVCATHIINHTPTHVVIGMTPYEWLHAMSQGSPILNLEVQNSANLKKKF